MSPKRPLSSRIRETLTIGGLLLVLLSLLLGAAIPLFASPRLALSTHLTGVQGGILLMVLGLAWRKVELGVRSQHIACWFVLLGTWLVWAGNLLGAIFATGWLTPIASSNAAGQFNNELMVAVALGLGSTLLIVSITMLLMGLMRQRRQSIANGSGR